VSDPALLTCPTCGRSYAQTERFCEACAMPLVHEPGREAARSERQRAVRKIKPQYTEGRLVRVARADNLIQAEFIAGILLEEGIPSTLSATIAGYAPVVGGRDVLVAESGAQAAREALAWQGRTRGEGSTG